MSTTEMLLPVAPVVRTLQEMCVLAGDDGMEMLADHLNDSHAVTFPSGTVWFCATETEARHWVLEYAACHPL